MSPHVLKSQHSPNISSGISRVPNSSLSLYHLFYLSIGIFRSQFYPSLFNLVTCFQHITAKMFSIKSLALFTTIALTAGVNAHAISARNNDITEPACPTKDFVPFKYVGCYNDPSTPNALQYNSYLDSTDMTIETCSGFCKGM